MSRPQLPSDLLLRWLLRWLAPGRRSIPSRVGCADGWHLRRVSSGWHLD